MKRLLLLFLFAALLLPGMARAESARFLNVIDGDSIMVRLGHRPVEVRLIGIDAPEWDQEYGVQAKTFTMRFCYGKELRLEYDREKRDRYGRLLAYVYDDRSMLNEELVKSGLAMPIMVKPNGRYYGRLKQAEKIAREERRGFWLRGGLSMTPGQWRKKQKKS
ncbi:thermonuclease family protein [Salidesulfovibrio onnuriiensis]|uniref:thermonuclease family protein n=1 Tax=Salidesulfovibrio onnuriiensis TaxID=2583823 RepID=UPI0011CBD03E|nr:thermonuclease family protein [Salidesulfovibrio onnuriiensis]